MQKKKNRLFAEAYRKKSGFARKARTLCFV